MSNNVPVQNFHINAKHFNITSVSAMQRTSHTDKFTVVLADKHPPCEVTPN